MTRPDWPDLFALIRPHLELKGSGQPDDDDWVTFRCPDAARHQNGDQHFSARANVVTGGVRCMSQDCPIGPNLNNLAERFGIDGYDSEVLGDPLQRLAEERKLPLAALRDQYGIRTVKGGWAFSVDDADAKGRPHMKRDWVRWNDDGAPKNWWPKGQNVPAKDLVYGLSHIPEGTETIYIAAGEIDDITLLEAGYDAVSFLAGEGTAPSTRAIHKLIEHGIRAAVFVYDVDKAGREGAPKVSEACVREGLQVHIVQLPDDLGEGGDINDLWIRCDGDREAFAQALEACPMTKVDVSDNEEAMWAAVGTPAAAPSTNGASPAPQPTWEPLPLPDDHYVRRYIQYAQGRTDAPPQYHEGLAVAQLSAVVGRGLRIPLAAKPDGMRCNVLLLMLGDSTLFRKTTCEDLATDLLRVIDDAMFLANDSSPQGFIQELSMRDGGTSLWHRDEFRSFLAQLQKAGWMAGGKELLMKMFDGSSYHRRLRTKTVKGQAIADEEYVRKPYLVVIAAGVTSRIVDVLTIDDVVDGFIPRFLIVAPKQVPPRRPASTITSEIEAERRGLIATLKNIYQGFKERGDCSVQFDDGVLDHWNSYAARIEAEASASPNPDTFGPIAGRMSDYALKIATLLQAAEGAPAKGSNLHLTLPMLEAAIELCERLRKDAEELAMEVGSSAGERKLSRFVKMVLQHPGIARREVARSLKVDKRDLDDLEATAIDRELITCVNRNTRGRPSKCYFPHQS